MRRLLTLATVVLALIAAAGCGGSGGGDQLSKQEYQQRLDQAGQTLSQSSNGLAGDVSAAVQGDAAAGDRAAGNVQAFQEDLRDTADELDDVNPPDDATEGHDQLVTGLRAYADDLDGLHDALQDGDETDIAAKVQGLQSLESVKTIDRAGDRLKDAGYDLEGTPGSG